MLVDAKSCFLGWLRRMFVLHLDGPGSIKLGNV